MAKKPKKRKKIAQNFSKNHKNSKKIEKIKLIYFEIPKPAGETRIKKIYSGSACSQKFHAIFGHGCDSAFLKSQVIFVI